MTIKVIIRQTGQEFEFTSTDIHIINSILAPLCVTNPNIKYAKIILDEILHSCPLNKDCTIEIEKDFIYGRDSGSYNCDIKKEITYKINEKLKS